MVMETVLDFRPSIKSGFGLYKNIRKGLLKQARGLSSAAPLFPCSPDASGKLLCRSRKADFSPAHCSPANGVWRPAPTEAGSSTLQQ